MCTNKQSPVQIESLDFAVDLTAVTERKTEIQLLNIVFKPGVKRSIQEFCF